MKKGQNKTSKKKVSRPAAARSIRKREDLFPVVAIGGSAGGLEAVTELLKNLSPSTGMAYVYIQHLDPTHESMLSTILSKSTKMPVLEAKSRSHCYCAFGQCERRSAGIKSN